MERVGDEIIVRLGKKTDVLGLYEIRSILRWAADEY